MIKLFFDIETIPCDEESREKHIEILRKKNGNSAKTDTQIHESMSFSGEFGRVCCIGIIKEDSQKVLQKEVFRGEEKEILTKFWDTASDVDRFIGHNIWDFDFPFIYKRSIINSVKPRELSFVRYRNIPIFDTMKEWDLWSYNKAQSLDTLAKIFGFPTSKDEMDGSQVWQYYQDGKIEEICKYCMKDVELTRQVYNKMTFEETSPSDDIPF